MTAEELLKYGIQQFNEEHYDAALEAMAVAYMNGYQQEWILDNIYTCYVNGNEQEFRESYENCCIYEDIPYESCSLDFVPYREGEYFIYDKLEHIFQGTFSVWGMAQVEDPETEFDDAAAEFDWDWRAYQETLKWTESRRVYVICHDRNRAVSFCKIPELADYFKQLTAFSDREAYQRYFHEHTSVYLPRIYIADEQSQQELMRIRREEHEYRLTPEGRNTDNILLTIGIPTHDRGNLALQNVKNLLNMIYDAEIEIMVSKNGTTLYQEEYQQIGMISDARLHYVDHKKELTGEMSWRKTVELSKGRFVLLVSDEDNVIIDVLDKYLAILAQNPGLSFVRAKTIEQYHFIKDEQGKKGREAFSKIFLRQNYISGAIVNRKLFVKLPLEHISEYARDNIFYRYYRHDWWFSLLSFAGDYRAVGTILIAEGKDVWEKQYEDYKKAGADMSKYNKAENGILQYATYSSRLEQFKGCIALLHFIEDKGIDIIELGVRKAISKTGFLIEIAYAYKYKQDEIGDVLNEYSQLCIWAVDEFSFDAVQKDALLQWTIMCILNAAHKMEKSLPAD